jgi:hypothetical protein
MLPKRIVGAFNRCLLQPDVIVARAAICNRDNPWISWAGRELRALSNALCFQFTQTWRESSLARARTLVAEVRSYTLRLQTPRRGQGTNRSGRSN